MDRLGLGYEALAAINPRIVYCAITGYGQTGPKARVAARDLNDQAEAGLLGLAARAGCFRRCSSRKGVRLLRCRCRSMQRFAARVRAPIRRWARTTP